MTFFIVLFIVLMQFLWKYIDDLVGKGLSFDVLGELFFYAAVTLVPMALPLAILLASLMTFGNLGERSELTAIKASGISLLNVMKPLIILVMAIAVGAFFFQNDILPKAQVKMWTLLFSMKQKSPEVEIPEGVFTTRFPGYNLYVKSKNQQTGVLYDVMIYDISWGGDNSTILLADSARMALQKTASICICICLPASSLRIFVNSVLLTGTCLSVANHLSTRRCLYLLMQISTVLTRAACESNMLERT